MTISLNARIGLVSVVLVGWFWLELVRIGLVSLGKVRMGQVWLGLIWFGSTWLD